MQHREDDERKSNRQGFPLEDLLARYAPSLLRYLSGRLGDKRDAQDIAQEAYLRLSRVKDADLILKPESYLFRIAANLASELLLKNSRKVDTMDLDTLQFIGGDSDDDIFQRQIEAGSDVKKIDQILDSLPPLYKAVLVLKKREGLSHKEIAEELSISTHAVNRYLVGALKKCRTEWFE